jgi:thiol-disulfide isomerase/thioredoxin
VVAEVKGSPVELKITLPPASPLRLQVVNEAGQPEKGLWVSLLPELAPREQAMSTEPAGLVWFDQTDDNGRLTWSNAPATPRFYSLLGSSGTSQFKQLRGGGLEQRIVLGAEDSASGMTRMKVRVLDARTRKPLGPVEVLSRAFPHLPWAPAFTTNVSEFELSFPNAAVSQAATQLRVAGYGPMIFQPDTVIGDGPHEVLLVADSRQSLQLVDPEGQSISKATAWIAPDTEAHRRLYLSRFENQPMQVYGAEFAQIKTDERGTLQLSVANPELPLVILNEDWIWTGRVKDLAGKQQLTLSNYGKVEGKLIVPGRTARSTRVAVNFGIATESGVSIVGGSVYGQTKPDGSFTLPNIPPGDHLLQRIVDPRNRPGEILLSHTQPVHVGVSETVKVAYTFQGRNLIGSLETEGDSPDNWSDCQVYLQATAEPVSQKPAKPLNYFVTPRRFSRQAGFSHSENPSNFFRGFIQEDATFAIEDIPPGKYVLNAIVHKPGQAPRQQWDPIPKIGELQQEITISPSSDPLDLGTLHVHTTTTTTTATGKSERETRLRAVTADGKPVTLPEATGKPLIIAFWTTWSAASQTRLRELHEWMSASAVSAELVGINIDEEPAAAAQFGREQKLPGRLLAWGNSLRSEGLSQTAVSLVPTVWVFDARGKLTRVPSTKRLATLVASGK